MKKIYLFLIATILIATGAVGQQNNNLLSNPGNFSDSFEGWDIVVDGGDGIASYASEGIDGGPCYIGSFGLSLISQTIDLVAVGYNAAWLDEGHLVQFSDMYKGRLNGSSAADEYQLTVKLLDANMNEITAYNTGTLIASDEWQQEKGSFRNYGSGLRYLYFEHGGRGVDGWAGNYGIMLDDSFLSIGNAVAYNTGVTRTLTGWTDETGGWGFNAESRWTTSYFSTIKSQVIDLAELGYSNTELDATPDVIFSEWYKGTFPEFGDIYFCEVSLLDANMNVIDSYNNEVSCTEEWQQSYHIFENYGTGLRYIRVQHGGLDIEFFAGNYGSVIDATSIELSPSTTIGVKDIAKETSFFEIAPNPSNGQVFLSSVGAPESNVAITVSDISGKVVFQENNRINNARIEMDLSFLNSGMYFIYVNGAEIHETLKMIIQ